LFGIGQPHVSEQANYKLTRFSSERLMHFFDLPGAGCRNRCTSLAQSARRHQEGARAGVIKAASRFAGRWLSFEDKCTTITIESLAK
jgi:hypothetical protein